MTLEYGKNNQGLWEFKFEDDHGNVVHTSTGPGYESKKLMLTTATMVAVSLTTLVRN